MTREKQIQQVSEIFSTHDLLSFSGACEELSYGFSEGAKWADKHPKSPCISVKEDLPCNHKEFLLSTGYHTVSVFTYKKGGSCGIDSMINRNGKWEWEAWKENYLYWMPIPKLPKV